MPLQKLPVTGLDDINHRRRARETLNQVLDHSFDDSRVRTPAEVAAGVTPVNYAYEPGDVRRYQPTANGSFDVSQTADWTAAIQAAMDSNNNVYFPALDLANGSFYGLSAPLYINDSQAPNLKLVGMGRVNTYLHPLLVDIKDANNINAFLINLANDRKFSMENLRFWSGVAYTGVVLNCVQTGDAKAIFSGSIQNCWFGLSSQNSGMLHGGFSNYLIANNVWEFCNPCVILEGAGVSDLVFSNNQCFFCIDEFVRKTDTSTEANLITIDTLHMYLHQRGRAVAVTDIFDLKLSKITMQMIEGAGNLGSGGIADIAACRNVTISDCITTANDLDTGEVEVGFHIENSLNVRVSNCVIDGADDGILITGSGATTATFDNLQIVNTVNSGFRVPVGENPQGVVTLNGCDISNGLLHLVTFTDEAGFDFFVNHCRFVNAGLGSGATGGRNFAPATSGLCIVTDTVIGQNDGAANAQVFVQAAGSGPTVIMHNPEIVGTPPVALKAGAQAVTFIYRPLVGTATYDPANLADAAGATTTVTVTGAAMGDFASASFSNDLQGISLTAYVSAANTVSVRFQNESGGALDLASGTLAAKTQRVVTL